MNNKAKNTMPQKTWGPCVIQKDGSTELNARCISGRFYCLFLHGNTCSHQKPPKAIHDVHETPDWCEFKASALDDAKGMM